MKSKRLIFLISLGLVVPNLGSCSAPSIVDKIIVDGKDKIEIGETTSFKADIYPTPKTEQTINWTTSNSDVAYVDKAGNVTGTSKGKATITAKVGSTETKQDVFIGGYIENHVTNISINGISDLKVGDYKLLNVTVSPENATNKEISWSSSDPKIASVNEKGVVKGEFTGEATITAISKENNQIVDKITIKVDERDPSKKLAIKSFSEPDCLIHYKDKINTLEDKIDQTKINRDNSKQYINNNFFKYDEGEEDKQIYKVGTDNPFRFKCNITTTNGDDPFKEIHDNNPYQTFELKDADGNDKSDLIESNYKGNEFQFKSDAIKESKLLLTVKPDNNKYENITELMSATIEFKVIEGYNAYDFAGLTTIDNWTEKQARIYYRDSQQELDFMDKNPFIDLWGDYKKKHKIPTNSKATILHNDIAIELDELPDNIVWTEHEVSDYVNGIKFAESKNNFNEFVEIKKSIHQDDWNDLPDNVVRAKCMNLMYKSLKDYVFIFQRGIRNTDFNYSLEGNYFNIDCSKIKPVVLFENEKLQDYQKIKMLYTSIIGVCHNEGRKTYSKTTSQGEYVYDLNRPYYGKTHFTPEEFITINNLNAFGNSTKDSTHDESIGVPCFINGLRVHMNNLIIHKFSTVMQTVWTFNERITKCKLFDTFAPIICADNTRLIIQDSILKDGDGGCFRITADGTNRRDSKIVCNNSYLESFISGYEMYNKTNIKTIFTTIIGNCAKECFEKYKDVKFGKDGSYAPKNPRNYIKIEDEIIYKNVIAVHEVSTDLTSTPTDGTFTLNHKEVYDIKKDYGENGNLRPYIDSSLLVSCCMEGEVDKEMKKDKGSARVPVLDVVSGDDIETFDKNGYAVRISDYVNSKDNYDTNNPEVGEKFGNLFRGDYLTYMFDLAGKEHFGFVLGYK